MPLMLMSKLGLFIGRQREQSCLYIGLRLSGLISMHGQTSSSDPVCFTHRYRVPLDVSRPWIDRLARPSKTNKVRNPQVSLLSWSLTFACPPPLVKWRSHVVQGTRLVYSTLVLHSLPFSIGRTFLCCDMAKSYSYITSIEVLYSFSAQQIRHFMSLPHSAFQWVSISCDYYPLIPFLSVIPLDRSLVTDVSTRLSF